MSRPRFSIVIPTRGGVITLPATLRTCLAQEFDDYEIIVADNCSPQATRDVVERFGSKRIRYIRSDRPLAMTDNWERAVAAASGEYVTVLGDDDGLLAHALREIDRILRLADARALRWECARYMWPDLPPCAIDSANELLIPLRGADGTHVVAARRAGPTIAAAGHGRVTYAELPSIYCSAVHRDVLETLRSRTGRVFRSPHPDVYSAFAIGYVVGTYHSVSAPMGVNALSGKSNGVAVLDLQGRSAIAREFHALNEDAGHQRHPWVPDLPAMGTSVAEAFLRAREDLFPYDLELAPDRRRLIEQWLKELVVESDTEWRTVLDRIRATLVGDLDLLTWFDAGPGITPRSSGEPRWRPTRRYGGHYLHLDASEFGVTDLVGAVALCERLLGYARDGIAYRVVEPAHEAEDGASMSLEAQLREKEAVIQKLKAAADERLRMIGDLSRALESVTRVTRLATTMKRHLSPSRWLRGWRSSSSAGRTRP